MVEVRIGESDAEIFSYEEFEARVVNGQIADSAWVRFEPVTGEEFVLAGELDLVKALRRDATRQWRDRFRNAGPPVLTALLVGIQIRIWLYTWIPATGTNFAYGWVNWLSPALENGQSYRLITHGLLHTDFLHILLNMVWLAYTGWNIERALGRANLAAIFFFSVLSGGILSMFLTPYVPSLGASGGVYGLVSASVVFGLVRQELLPERGRVLFGVALLPYLVLMFLGGLWNDSTDNWAHFGGLVCGAVLAFVLDPPGLERRPGRNRLIQLGGAAFSIALLAALSLFGPRLYPLVDKEVAVYNNLPRKSRKSFTFPDDSLLLKEFTWQVPSGWKTGANTAGDTCFRSPAVDQRRSWAVVQDDANVPVSIEEIARDWRDSLARGNADATFEELEPKPWLGLDSGDVYALRATVPQAEGEVILEFIGTSRGVYSLYRVAEFEASIEDRLAPLFDRLDEGIDWREPLALQAARRNADAAPRSVKARSELALHLARWGVAEEALALQKALVDERPDDDARWAAWIDTVGWYPEVSQPDVVLSRAVTEVASPRVVTRVALAFRRMGREQEADALLQAAWLRDPGDRDLRRALKKARLPYRLDSTGLPTELAFLPDGSARPSDAVAEVLSWPLDMEHARRWAEMHRAERTTLAGRFEPSDPFAALDILLWLREGNVAPEEGEHRVLRKDLGAVADDERPRWMPAEVFEALRDESVRQGLVDALP